MGFFDKFKTKTVADKPTKPVKKDKQYFSKANESKNPYLENTVGYIEIRGSDLLQKNSWKVSCFILVILVFYLIHKNSDLASQSNIIPVVYKEDPTGGLTYVGVANQQLPLKTNYIRSQLSDYITALRSVPNDEDTKNLYVNKIRAMTSKQVFIDTVAPILIPRYELNQKTNQSIAISLKTIVAISDHTYQIEWTENTTPITRYRAILSFEQLKQIQDPAVGMNDPLGISINELNISPVNN